VWRRVVELFNILTGDSNGPQVARPLSRAVEFPSGIDHADWL
jgi:hypothetical protein